MEASSGKEKELVSFGSLYIKWGTTSLLLTLVRLFKFGFGRNVGHVECIIVLVSGCRKRSCKESRVVYTHPAPLSDEVGVGDIRGQVNKGVNDEVKGWVYPECMTGLNLAFTKDKGSYGRLAEAEEQHRDRRGPL